MRGALPGRSLVLAIHPTSYGFAYILFESPFVPLEWRNHGFSQKRDERCLRKIAALLDRRMPETVVVERFEGFRSLRSPRIAKRCRSIRALCENRGIEFAVYDREAVAGTFKHAGARTRDEIAAAVALHIDVLRPKLPPPRRAWDAEDRRRPIFTAAALALTHYRLDADRLLAELRRR